MADDALVATGLFWFARDKVPRGRFAPDSAVPGQLTISDEGRIDLRLDGLLSRPNKRQKAATDGDASAIQGYLVQANKYCLLLDAFESGVHLAGSGASTETFRAFAAFVGDKRIDYKTSGLRFSSAEFELAGYSDWFSSNRLKIKPTKRSFSLRYVSPNTSEYDAPWGKVEVIRYLKCDTSFEEGNRNLNASERATILARYHEPLTYKEVLRNVGLIRDLLVVLSNSARRGTFATLKLAGQKATYVLYHQRLAGEKFQKNSPPWTTFAEVAGTFGDLIFRWASASQAYGPGVYLYLGTRRGFDLFEEHRLVNLIWGLETLHRRKNPEKAVNAPTIERMNRIFAAVSDARDRKWLKWRLRYASEVPLEERLFQLLSPLPFDLDQARLKAFCKACAQYRNNMSHHGGVRADEDYTKALHAWNDHSAALDVFYHILLLVEIAVEPQIIERVIKRSTQYRWYFERVELIESRSASA
ncbi:MAG TPA: HEPN domain-containing protein [Caulobacteraceae bacterium]